MRQLVVENIGWLCSIILENGFRCLHQAVNTSKRKVTQHMRKGRLLILSGVFFKLRANEHGSVVVEIS